MGRLSILGLLAFQVACGDVPLANPGPPQGTLFQGDAGLADVSIADSGSADLSRHADGPVDSSPDQAIAEDASSADGAGEGTDSVSPPDAPSAVDATPPDSANNDGPGTADAATSNAACAGSVQGTVVQVFDQEMVMCSYGAPFEQCHAVNRCGAGWHLCTATDYRLHGGDAVSPLSAAWLASCIRDATGPVYAPSDAICGGCTSPAAPAAFYAWSCASGAVEGGALVQGNLGVRASPSRVRLGENSSENCAYWDMHWVNSALSRAMCCQD